jgi:hypothetical protein
MVAALRSVCREPSGSPAPPKPRALRFGRALAALAAAGLLGLVLWRPPAVMDRIAAFAPREAHAALGEAAILAYAGDALCAPDAEARRALQAFVNRLAPQGAAEGPIVVKIADLADPPAPALMAPGGRALVFRRTVEQGPAALAEALAVAIASAERRQPTTEALRAAGARGVIGALSGDLGYGGLAQAARAKLVAPDVTADDAVRAALMLELAGLGVGAEPFTSSAWRAIRRACGP